MAEEKPSGKQSFRKLLESSGSAVGGGEKSEKASLFSRLSRKSQEGEEEKKRRPIAVPIGQSTKEGVFSIGYKEWAFLLGAMLLLFGGMGLIRWLAPKEAPVSLPFTEVAPGEFDEGVRPPGGGDLSEEVVTELKARDSTRLVKPPESMTQQEKKKEETPVDRLRDSIFGGLKEAEKSSPPRPRLPQGLLNALSSALAGTQGSSASQAPHKLMSAGDIAQRIQTISPQGPRGTDGLRLGYSGGQKVPGIAGGMRQREASAGDDFRKAQQAGRDAVNALQGVPDAAAAQAGRPFGEVGKGDAVEKGDKGANVGGETPAAPKSETPNVNYQLKRYEPPWAVEEWKLQHADELNWAETKKTAMIEGAKLVLGEVGGPLLKTVMGKPTEAKDIPIVKYPGGSITQKAWVAGKCGSVAQSGGILQLAQDQPSPQACSLSVIPYYVEETKNEDGDKKGKGETKKPGQQIYACGSLPYPCNKVSITTEEVQGGGTGLLGLLTGFGASSPANTAPADAPAAAAGEDPGSQVAKADKAQRERDSQSPPPTEPGGNPDGAAEIEIEDEGSGVPAQPASGGGSSDDGSINADE